MNATLEKIIKKAKIVHCANEVSTTLDLDLSREVEKLAKRSKQMALRLLAILPPESIAHEAVKDICRNLHNTPRSTYVNIQSWDKYPAIR